MPSFTGLKAVSVAAALLAGAGATQAQEVVSQLPAFLVTETSTLPEGPYVAGGADDCRGNYAAPESAAAKLVESKGWGVISEAQLGAYGLVSFAGAFLTGTSGSCAIEQSNIGVFDGETLKAIIYTENASDQLIGVLNQHHEGPLRIWSGDYLSTPVGDIAQSDAGLVVGPVAAEDHFCGAAVVPNIYETPIDEARGVLKAAGWKPVEQPSEEFGQQVSLQEAGIVEAESCSGTGFGFCRYAYRSAGALLDVTSVGEMTEDGMPMVVDYAVTCAN